VKLQSHVYNKLDGSSGQGSTNHTRIQKQMEPRK
jgi:hypothetical protein